MELQVTRCPHCETSFRIREPHLAAANGLVRCGSCLQVFNAKQHLLNNNAPEEQPSPAVTNNVIPFQSAKLQQAKKQAEAAAETVADTENIEVTEEASETSEVVAEVELDEIQEETSEVAPELEVAELESPAEEITEAEILENESPETESLETENPASDNADASPESTELTESAEDEFAEEDFEIIFDQSEDEEPELDIEAFSATNDDSTEEISATEEVEEAAEEASIGTPIEIKVETIAALKAEPLALQRRKKNSWIPFAWLAGSGLLLLLAAAQFLYFNFDKLSRTPQWRPVFTQVCQFVPCQLPQIQDINSISAQHFAVNRHPQLQGALLVDVLLFNQAQHVQPFPDVRLNFHDLNERTIATRTFRPSQYLAGELTGAQDMPVRTPVHIAFELLDPGVEAVSYEVQLLANQ